MKVLERLDARGWIALAIYALVLVDMILIAFVKELRGDEFFKTISTLIFGAFLKDVVGWAFQATKGGGELADRNASIVEDAARSPSGNPVTVAPDATSVTIGTDTLEAKP